jgi:hypothetical protein
VLSGDVRPWSCRCIRHERRHAHGHAQAALLATQIDVPCHEEWFGEYATVVGVAVGKLHRWSTSSASGQRWLTSGAILSVSEIEREASVGESASARAGPRVRERASARARGWAARLLGRAEREEETRPEMKFLFFFFKNMNSDSFCLFQ